MNTNMNMSSSSEISSFIEWHHEDICQVPDVDKFGILHIDIPPMPTCTGTLSIMFNIDKSGSMDDLCSDSSTKMQHIHHALKNILRVLVKTLDTEPDLTIRVAICVFSHNTHNLFDIVTDLSGAIMCDKYGFTTIHSENIQSILKKIDTIDPWGLTNIEKSLKYTQTSLADYHTEFPEHRLVHIQFTDGEATVGKKTYQELIEFTDQTYKHVYIGIGDFHDSYLLTNLSQNLCLGEYRFIDQLENSGMICGEILYDILHPYHYPNNPIKIITNNGVKIFDWRINQWTTCLNIPAFSGNRSKDFQLCFNDETGEHVYENAVIDIYSVDDNLEQDKDILLEMVKTLPQLLNQDGTPVVVDLTTFILRQFTQEYLYEAAQHELMFRSDIYCLQRENRHNNRNNQSSENIRQKLELFAKTLELYQNNMLLETDRNFVQVLKDDIRITLHNMDTDLGFMYSNSRQTSQGNQYSYVPTGNDILSDNNLNYSTLERNISTNVHSDIYNMMTQVQNIDDLEYDNSQSDEEDPKADVRRTVALGDDAVNVVEASIMIPSPIRRESYTKHFEFPKMEDYISTQQIN